MIPLSSPLIDKTELAYVTDCLKSGWVSSVGEFVTEFEERIAAIANTKYAVATSSGTAALHLAVLAAKLGPNDEVLVSNLTFVAPVNAIKYVGAHPVLVDAENRYWQMDFDLVESFLEKECDNRNGMLINIKTGRRVKALLPVHILGNCVDLKRASELAERFNLLLIEDASESLGALSQGKPVGGIGDMGCFSFNGNKLLTCGGGGMLVTNNKDYADKARYLSTQAKDDRVEYVHGDVGYNYRLTNIQAALGVAQCTQIDQFLSHKKKVADLYSESLTNISGITLPKTHKNIQNSWWLYTILIDQEKYGIDSRQLLKELHNKGIQSRPLWQPIHLNAPYVDEQRLMGDVSIALYRKAISIPCSVNLSDKEQDKVIKTIQELAKKK